MEPQEEKEEVDKEGGKFKNKVIKDDKRRRNIEEVRVGIIDERRRQEEDDTLIRSNIEEEVKRNYQYIGKLGVNNVKTPKLLLIEEGINEEVTDKQCKIVNIGNIEKSKVNLATVMMMKEGFNFRYIDEEANKGNNRWCSIKEKWKEKKIVMMG